jgi:hypothetical protein
MQSKPEKGTIGYTWNVYDMKTGKLLPIPKPDKKRKTSV